MPTPVEHVRDVILRDGRTLRLRPPLAGDDDAVLAFFRGLSDESAYRRFHGFPSLGAELVTPVLDPDWQERGALIGTFGEGGTSTLSRSRTTFGSAIPRRPRLRSPSPTSSRGTGSGTRLLEQLAELAADGGIESFVADVMGSNRAMLRVFEDAGFSRRT